MSTNSVFNNPRDWMLTIIITSFIALVVLVSTALDSHYDRKDFDRCVGREMHLGAERTIAEKLCHIQMERE